MTETNKPGEPELPPQPQVHPDAPADSLAEAYIDEDAPLWTPRATRIAIRVAIAVLVVVLLVVLPPYISVSRYQRRVATAMSQALGRPVYFSNITLHVLPLPGLTIDNFVVSELPQYGAEPILRANSVEARLRISSLWRRRIEVSQISLENPSINLSRRADGGWNVQSIVTQASQLKNTPTDQKGTSEAPPLPYIEATGARLNFKDGEYKLPFSLRDAEFSLWLPEPNEWHLRLKAQPVRTDADVTDIGLLNVEATIGRAANVASSPIDMTAAWKPTPLGQASQLAMNWDAGWRGEISGEMTLKGTVGESKLVADMHLAGLRRAEFVPVQSLDVQAHCEAVSGGLVRSLRDLRCAVPFADESLMPKAINALHKLPEPAGSTMPDGSVLPGVLFVRGEVPSILETRGLVLNGDMKTAHAADALTWARLFTKRVPIGAALGGTFDLTGHYTENPENDWSGSLVCSCILPDVDKKTSSASENDWTISFTHNLVPAPGSSKTPADVIAVTATKTLPDPEGKTPPMVPRIDPVNYISGQVSRSGYTLVYGSPAAAKQVAAVLPELMDGMPDDADSGLMAERAWSAEKPTWTSAPVAKPVVRRAVKRVKAER